MGLFGKDFDEKAAILSFFSPEAGQMYSSRKKDDEAKRKAEAERAQMHAIIDSDKDLSPLDREYAKRFPEAYIKVRMERFKPLDSGAAGGSRGLPGPNGTISNWQMAPSRHEFQGSVYDVTGGAPDARKPVIPQHEGTQWVTPQPGTTAFGVNSFSGLPRTGAPAPAAPSSGPVPGTVEDGYMYKGGDPADPASWVPVQGGASQQGARMFPGPQ